MGSSARTLKRSIAVLLAVAIVVGGVVLVVGGAPALFGVNDEPTASVTFEDQEGDGENVTLEELSLSDGGFVVIGDGTGTTLAVSEYLESGTHENVTVEADDEGADLFGQLTATVHQDTTDDERYADEEDSAADPPYLENGHPVSDTATVTPTDVADALGDSFLVESMDAPATATTNETVAVNATIHNPTENAIQQHVELRLDGTVTERQLIEIEAGGTRDVTFEVNTSDLQPGTHSIGVFTVEDGELDEIDLEFDGTPALEPVAGNETAISVNATLPEDGFVAIERLDDENETDDERERLGTSDALDGGDHVAVTVDLDESVADDEDLHAVLYAGDPDEADEATVVETDDGDPVEVIFTIEAVGE